MSGSVTRARLAVWVTTPPRRLPSWHSTESAAMAQNCVFCGATETTTEHVWPNWAAKRMSSVGLVDHWLHVVQDGEGDTDRSWPQKQFTLTVGAVCGTCNNGWMSNLEDRLKPFFEAAFDGKVTRLDALLQRDLAAWAVKTAMMAVAAQNPTESPFPASTYADLFANVEPPADMRLWVGAYSGAVSTAYAHTYVGDISIGDLDGDIRGGTVLFGPVLIQMLGSSIPGLAATGNMGSLPVHELWPYDADFDWEPSPGIDDKGLEPFANWFLDGNLDDGTQHRARQLP